MKKKVFHYQMAHAQQASQEATSQPSQALNREEMILKYAPLIKYIAHRLAMRLPSHIAVKDLMSAGAIGLMHAVSKFDPTKNVSFKSYAEFRIRGAMLDELRSCDPLSRDLRDLNNRISTAVRRLTSKLGRPPEESEIAEVLDLPVSEFRRRLARLSFGGLVSLDTTGGDAADGIEIGDDGTDGAESQLLGAERRERLARAVGELPERLQTLLRLYYEQDYTLREIGEQLGFTESRACQLHAEAISRLRAACDMSEERTGVRRIHVHAAEQDAPPRGNRRHA